MLYEFIFYRSNCIYNFVAAVIKVFALLAEVDGGSGDGSGEAGSGVTELRFAPEDTSACEWL